VNVYEVTFTVEGVDDDGEFFTDGQSALVIANSVEHCLELVKQIVSSLRKWHVEPFVRKTSQPRHMLPALCAILPGKRVW
jgi:hypothetical protein